MKRWLLFITTLCVSSLFASFSIPQTWHNACVAIEEKQWGKALLSLQILEHHCPANYMDGQLSYFLGVAYYHSGQMWRANQAFDRYLGAVQVPDYFESVIAYKFDIANRWSRRAYSDALLQRWQSHWRGGYGDALELYDQIASIMPNEEIAAFAMYNKAVLEMNTGHYKEALESFQAVIRCYENEELEVCSFFGIARVYFLQSQSEANDPDLLPLARLNLKNFEKVFPGDPRACQIEHLLRAMEETYANHALRMAEFYTIQEHPCAAKMYYELIVELYPSTCAAQKARRCLNS